MNVFMSSMFSFYKSKTHKVSFALCFQRYKCSLFLKTACVVWLIEMKEPAAASMNSLTRWLAHHHIPAIFPAVKTFSWFEARTVNVTVKRCRLPVVLKSVYFLSFFVL